MINKIKNIIIYGGISAVFFVSVATLTYFLLTQMRTRTHWGLSSLDTSVIYDNLNDKSFKFPKAYIVQSGSMEPAIKTGSIVISYPSNSYSEGDVVTFSKSVGAKNLITHRVEARFFPDGVDKKPTYLTSGDANEDFDPGDVKHEQIVGKVYLTVPYLGYAANFAKQPYGFILLVIVPATIIIYEELKGLLKELFKVLKSIASKIFRRRRTTLQGATFKGENLKGKGLPKVSAIFPIFGAALVLTGLASSFFSDKELSPANFFQASDDFGGPQIAQTLVINELLWNSSCTPNPETKFVIELYNGYSTQVDIKDWRFVEGDGTVIQISNAQFFIQPNSFVLIVKSESTFSGCYTNYTNAPVLNLGGNPDFTPTATGGIIKLEKPTGPSTWEIVDRVEYGPTLNSGTLNTAVNQSIERVPIGLDSALGDTFQVNDFILREFPTHGYGTNLVLNEILPDEGVIHTNEWVEIYNPSGSSIDLTGWTLKDIALSPRSLTPLGTINSGSWKVHNDGTAWLNNGAETLQLIEPGGKVIDQHSYSSTSNDVSIGRFEDRGNIWINCTSTSKGTTNTNFCQP